MTSTGSRKGWIVTSFVKDDVISSYHHGRSGNRNIPMCYYYSSMKSPFF